MFEPDLDPTSYDEALAAAKAYTGYGDTKGDLSRRLVQTAVKVTGASYWRPAAAAFRWLRANPKWISKATGLVGAEYRDLDKALAALLAEQASEDARLGLELPGYLAADFQVGTGASASFGSSSVPIVVL